MHGIVTITDTPRRVKAFGGHSSDSSANSTPNASPLQHADRPKPEPNNNTQPESDVGAYPKRKKGTQSCSIGAIIQNFKSVTVRRFNAMQRTRGVKLWQRGYYDLIIRDEEALQRVRQYIQNNPKAWELDRINPANLTN
ncbi:MAG: transposase [Leptolyngbyaceae cyanobacterium MO_188.B28]|nr:transposase [Leptolyngbyaceae cyanobacterium MO_188.B28]